MASRLLSLVILDALKNVKGFVPDKKKLSADLGGGDKKSPLDISIEPEKTTKTEKRF